MVTRLSRVSYVNLPMSLSILVNAVVVVILFVLASKQIIPVSVAIVFLILWAISIAGALMMLMGEFKWGSRLAYLGYVAFVPFGFIGMLGVHRVLEQVSKRNY